MKTKLSSISKLLLIVITFSSLLLYSGCDDATDILTDYKVTFWNSQSNVGEITVTFNGNTAVVTHTLSTAPDCNSSGNANFTSVAGSYTWSASAVTGETWSGTEVVGSAECTTIELN